LWLPEFQRPFVWDKNQIRLLIDSLYHDYSISSILIWVGGDELARRKVGGNINAIKIPEDKKEQIVYLLDGQQRATALMLAFTDKEVYRANNIKKKESINIYWDTIYDGLDPELRWIMSDEEIYSANHDNERVLQNMTQKEIFSRYAARFVKLKHAYGWDKIQPTVASEMNKNNDLFVKYNMKVMEIREKILLRKVHDIEQKGQLEQVLEVFERINTLNTKLSMFDIMVAKTYRKIEGNSFDLRTFLKILNYGHSVKPDYFKNVNNLDLDKVKLKVDENTMLFLIMVMMRLDFRANTILTLKTEELIENCKKLHDKYLYLVGFLRQHFSVEEEELGNYQPMMKFLSAAIIHFDKIDVEVQNFLRKWFWNTLLKNRYPGAQNERVARDYKYIKDYSLEAASEKMLLENTRDYTQLEKSTKDNPAYIEAYYSNKSQQIYVAMRLMLKSKGARDFYSGLMAVKSGTPAYRLEEHHIFPLNSAIGQSIVNKYKDSKSVDLINNIANIALITKETNNNRIKARNPSTYIVEFENAYSEQEQLGEFHKIMDSQFISKSMIELLKKDDFEGFIFERTAMLMEQIKQLCAV